MWAYLLGFAAVFGVSRAAVTRECGLAMIGALMGGAQAGLHVLFDAVQQATAPAGGRAVAGAMPGMAHGHPAMVAMAPGTMHLTGGMLLAHTVAALVLAWWLRCGEAAVFALARALRLKVAAVWALLLRPSDEVMPLVVPRVYGAVPEASGGGRRAIRFVVVRRGPPGVGLLV